MESSTRELVHLHRGLVALAGAALLVLLGVLGWVAAVSVVPAKALVEQGEPAPWAICWASEQTDLSVLERSLGPSDGASVQAGTPVTFSGPSKAPLTFALASSPASLSSPDIDRGLGSVQPGASPSTYVFTSTKATATPGTVYWDASFTDAALPGCEGRPQTLTTQARTLTVLPVPAPAPVSTPAPEPTPALPPVQVSISALGGFRPAHPIVAYSVHCTASCSGETSYEVFVLQRHAKAVRVPELDLGARPVSIASEWGGDERFAHHYSGRSLRLLKRTLVKGRLLELQLTVQVTDASGNVVRAQSAIRLRA